MGFSSTVVVILVISLSGVPIVYLLNKAGAMENPLYILLTGVLTLSLVLLLPALYLVSKKEKYDAFFYLISMFTFSSVIDLIVAAENWGLIRDFMTFYLLEGEPYLRSAHGTMISFWDGSGHLLMYITIFLAHARGQSHRSVGLYWVGSMAHSMIVFVPGILMGKYGIKWSVLLNVPYLVIPFWLGFRLLRQRTADSSNKQDQGKVMDAVVSSGLWRRPHDVLFVLYLLVAMVFAVFRGLTVLGCYSELSQVYLDQYEPYLKEENTYPKIQMLVYMFYFVPYYVCAIYGLWTGGGQPWMSDWALIHAGASAQGQFSHICASMSTKTAPGLRVPDNPSVRLIFYILNLGLLVLPQLLALRCVYDTNAVDVVTTAQAEKTDSAVKKKKIHKQK